MFKSRYFLIPIILITIISVIGCKKSEKEIFEEELTKAGNSSLNKEIADLKSRLAGAKDDFGKADIYSKISELEAQKGDFQSSTKSASESIKLYPGLAEPHYVLGKSYLAMGRFGDAEIELQTAAGINEKHVGAHFELGNLYYKLKKYPVSVSEYQLAIKYDPKHYQAYNNLGSVLYLLNKTKDAEAAYNQVKILNPKFAGVYKNLGMLYELKMMNKKVAAQLYREYLKRKPNASDRAAVKIWIANLEK